MSVADLSRPQRTSTTKFGIVVAATFTAEPIEESLAGWMNQLGLDGEVEFAPYNQVFQQLLDPGSQFSRNQGGVNVILHRTEDWLKFQASANKDELAGTLERNADDLVSGLKEAASRSSTPLLLVFCPPSPKLAKDAGRSALVQSIESRLIDSLQALPGLTLVRPDEFARYPVANGYDPQRDTLGHIPYTPLFFTALGTIVARKVHALKSHPYKVIVLDCDNTLWKGVVGEEGTAGVQITPGFQHLQEFVAEKAASGFVICLCSKNEERDVLDVFEQRADMALKLANVVAWRVNWIPKSENLRSLADELNLGLDSFIFLDDNPVECAEVRAACPEVAVLQVPSDDRIKAFLENIWALDRLKVTAEDQQRTGMYKENAERTRFRQQSQSFDDFLAKLELKIAIEEPSEDKIARVSQLTQRTNQFNFTTIRRSEPEIRQLGASGRSCRIVEVSDRFGDYGLVGVFISLESDEALEIDTFLLSCRVLGRGVEQRMLESLGKVAEQRGLKTVRATLIPTKKNQPARDFLMGVASDYLTERDGNLVFEIPTEVAATASRKPVVAAEGEAGAPAKPSANGSASKNGDGHPAEPRKLPPYERIAHDLQTAERIHEHFAAANTRRGARPALTTAEVAPANDAERQLSEVWADLLKMDRVGTNDDFFDLGGTSLMSVDLFSRIEDLFGVRLPLTALIEAPTVARLAERLTSNGSQDSLVLLRQGGDQPPVFLIHDGDGETLLYRNLALRLNHEHPVYGLQPLANAVSPILHSRIEEMAAHHKERIRSVQPHGPYLLGGMCAGGVIAYEVARQLRSEGEHVAHVALIDAVDPAAPEKAMRLANQRLQSLSSSLAGDAKSSPARRVFKMVGTILRKGRNFTKYQITSRYQRAADSLRMKRFRSALDRKAPLPTFLHGLSVRTVYNHAATTYRPATPFDGELTLFRATTGEGKDEPFIVRYDDPALGWKQRTTSGVRIVDVPGGHSSMLQEPNVDVLANEMQRLITEALSRFEADADTEHEPAETLVATN